MADPVELELELGPDEGLGAVLATSVEWMVPTSVGTVGLELQVLEAEGGRAPLELVNAWNAHLEDAVRLVLERKQDLNSRALARALLEELTSRALYGARLKLKGDEARTSLVEWPASLVLRPAGQDELQVRVRAQLTLPAAEA